MPEPEPEQPPAEYYESNIVTIGGNALTSRAMHHSYISVSDNGRAIITIGTGSSTTDKTCYYTHNYGESWSESTINWGSNTDDNIRGGYITKNGIYAIFFVPRGDGLDAVYLSEDGGANFTLIYNEQTHYWYAGEYFISEDGQHIISKQFVGNVSVNNQGPLSYRNRSTSNWIMTGSSSVQLGGTRFKTNGDFTKAFLITNSRGSSTHTLKKYSGTTSNRENLAKYAHTTTNGWSNVDSYTSSMELDMSFDGNIMIYSKGTAIYISRDGGTNFETVSSNVFTNITEWKSFGLKMSSDAQTIVVVSNDSMYLSRDIGYTWSKFSSSKIDNVSNITHIDISNEMIVYYENNDKAPHYIRL